MTITIREYAKPESVGWKGWVEVDGNVVGWTRLDGGFFPCIPPKSD